MMKHNSRGREILFKRAFLWSYVPENAKGVAAILLLSLPIVLLVAIVELVERAMDGANLGVLQFAILAAGLVAIQVFASRHS
jgi:hypothetical protein